jgi:hypothetical protein
MHNWYPLWLPHSAASLHHPVEHQQRRSRQPGGALPDRARHRRILRFPAARRPARRRHRLGVSAPTSTSMSASTRRAGGDSCSTPPSITACTIRRTMKPAAAITPAAGSSSTGCSAPASTARPNCWAWKAVAACRSARQMTYPFTEGWKTLKERFGRPGGLRCRPSDANCRYSSCPDGRRHGQSGLGLAARAASQGSLKRRACGPAFHRLDLARQGQPGARSRAIGR